MSPQRRAADRTERAGYEIVAAALPFGPPLTALERALQAGVVLLFLSLLAAEGWTLWHVWSLLG